MTEHKATPEQWAQIELQAQRFNDDSCLIELRDRVEALELWRATTGNAAPAARDRDKGGLACSDDSLVEQVEEVIWAEAGEVFVPDARTAIHAIANWLDQQELHSAATRLRMEVG